MVTEVTALLPADSATNAGDRTSTGVKPYMPPRITSRLPLEARAGTPIGGFYGYRDPKTGKKYDPQHPPDFNPYDSK